MKKLALFIVILITTFYSYSQDTIVVQTLSFDSITTRRGVWAFPDTSHSYRKVLMQYTLKCDAATTQDGYACGEWDYLTYTNIYEHTGMLDSTLAEHPLFVMGASWPDSFLYSTDNSYSIYQQQQFIINYDSIINENNFLIGSDISAIDYGAANDGHAQFYWPDSVLMQSGITAGDISGIQLHLESAGSMINKLCIKMKSASSFSSSVFDDSGFTTVFSESTYITGNSWQSFNFTTNFNWDGTSGIIIDLSYDNDSPGVTGLLYGEILPYQAAVYAEGSDNYVSIDGENFVTVPVDTLSGLISDEITISFWQYGDPNYQPQSDYLFEARNAYNKRVLGSHLPWSNGNVYWDAGNTGNSSYDRIYKAANLSDYAGKWNHWAFTKNTQTGSMKIYLNGTLWHAGSGKTKPMTGITKFVIGASAIETSFYKGFINELRIWNKELSASEISDWMYKSIDSTHTSINNLICYYTFDEESGYVANDLSGVTGNAYLMGAPTKGDVSGEDYFMNPEPANFRPNIIFTQGDYISHIDTVIVNDTVYSTPMSVVQYEIGTNEVHAVDTVWHNQAGWFYVYNSNGDIIDSTWFSPQSQLNNQILQYYLPPFEVINQYEIGRYITPYGIGLSLGSNGFTWTYDVTDYASLLHDSVDLSAGNQQELIDIKFIMIEGTPARDVKEITQIWGKRASYHYSALDEDTKLSNKRIGLNPDASTFKVKTRITGHGHNSSNGNYPHCCEWKDNTHYLIVNGDSVVQWHIWQDFECAQNPVYPQGGTWPGAREGWCPGDKVHDNEFEITQYVLGDSVDIDYDISDVPASNPGMGGGNYVMAMQLFQYGAPNFNNDAEILDVISPNDFGYYSRENPICYEPKILIRNAGSDILTTLVFEYSVSGGTTKSYNWVGSLNFMEEEIVRLPIDNDDFWIGDGDNIFQVSVSLPSGNADENSDNNLYSSTFTLPDVYDDNFIIMYKSNNLPQENYYEIKDMDGNVVFSRYTANASTMYYDTLNLTTGCYTLNLYDTGNDGLSYWAYPEQGNGYFKLKKIGGGMLRTFESEFGYNIMYSFSLSDGVSIHENNNKLNIELFPNPTKDFAYFDISDYTGNISVKIFDAIGKEVYTDIFSVNNSFTKKLNLGTLKPGVYYLKALGNNVNYSNSIIIEK